MGKRACSGTAPLTTNECSLRHVANRVGTDIRVVIADLNPLLRGWGNYFRTGNAAVKFRQVDSYVEWRKTHSKESLRRIARAARELKRVDPSFSLKAFRERWSISRRDDELRRLSA